MGLEPAPVIRY